ncbi:MAG: ArsR/SmtB family transcription factor [Bacillota bacterium]|jgi:DNA-binding transcriptional ArsR family regulator
MFQHFLDSCEEYAPHMGPVEQARQALLPEEEVDRLAAIFKALGDPTRVRIIQVLSSAELCVCDLAEVLGMSQSAISHQLRVLRNLHIVKNRREGKEVFYSLDDEHVLQLLRQALDHIRHTV